MQAAQGPALTRPLALAGDRFLAGGVWRAALFRGQVSDPDEVRDPRFFALSLDLILGSGRPRVAGAMPPSSRRRLPAGLSPIPSPRRSLAVTGACDRRRHGSVASSPTSWCFRQQPNETEMVTLGVALGLASSPTALLPHISGGRRRIFTGFIMGKVLGRFEFDLFGAVTAQLPLHASTTSVRADAAGAPHRVHSPFGCVSSCVADAIRRNEFAGRRAIVVPVIPADRGYTLSAAYAGGCRVACLRRPRALGAARTSSSSTALPTFSWCGSSARRLALWQAARARLSTRRSGRLRRASRRRPGVCIGLFL